MVSGVVALKNWLTRGSVYFKVVATYVGSIIGAGFASGQEIMQFFIVFGDSALSGIVLSGVLFAYLGAVTLYLASDLMTSSYKKLYLFLLGLRASSFMDLVSLFMLAGGLGIMLAGSGAVFSEHLELPGRAGILLAAVITWLVIICGLQGVLTIYAFLVPLKIAAIVMICLWSLVTGCSHSAAVEGTKDVAGNWVWSAMLYVSYNMILTVAVLSSLGSTINKKEGVVSGVVGGLGLGLTAGIITVAGLAQYPEILAYQVPLLFLAQQAGPLWQKFLGVLIWLAILTTAIANAHGFASRLAPPNSRQYKLIGSVIVLLAVPLSGFEFTKLVKTVYPFFGYAGLVLFFSLLVAPLKKCWPKS